MAPLVAAMGALKFSWRLTRVLQCRKGSVHLKAISIGSYFHWWNERTRGSTQGPGMCEREMTHVKIVLNLATEAGLKRSGRAQKKSPSLVFKLGHVRERDVLVGLHLHPNHPVSFLDRIVLETRELEFVCGRM